MKNFGALLVIALIAIVVLVFATNPELLGKVWLYIIGFIGYVVALVEKGFKSISQAFQKTPENPENASPLAAVPVAIPDQIPSAKADLEKSKLESRIRELENRLDTGNGGGEALGKATLTVLRYFDDGETTLGLIFLRNKFFAYTLEDTFREEKVKGSTRIPEGTYELGFSPVSPQDSGITRDYLAKYPWFTKHIHLKNVPGYEGIYIHIGNTHNDTEGCILIADGINSDIKKALVHSTRAYERLYKIVSALLESNEKLTIQVLNESWFEKSKMIST